MWFRDQFGGGRDYLELDAEANEIPATSDGLILLPYFIGEKTPIFDTRARGVFFGLSLHHTRAHLYHAILEGISYGFYHHIQVLKESGFEIQRVRVSNGGAHSKLWRQVTSDVVGLPLEEVANHPGIFAWRSLHCWYGCRDFFLNGTRLKSLSTSNLQQFQTLKITKNTKDSIRYL